MSLGSANLSDLRHSGKKKKGSQIQNASDFVSENIIVHIISSFSFSL